MEYHQYEELIKEWGGLMPIVDPKKGRTGDVQGQINALLHNISVFPHIIEAVKNDMIPIVAKYNTQYLEWDDKLTVDYCILHNIKGNQHGVHIRTQLRKSPEDIGFQLDKYENRLDKLEKDFKTQNELLWTYRKPGF